MGKCWLYPLPRGPGENNRLKKEAKDGVPPSHYSMLGGLEALKNRTKQNKKNKTQRPMKKMNRSLWKIRKEKPLAQCPAQSWLPSASGFLF